MPAQGVDEWAMESLIHCLAGKAFVFVGVFGARGSCCPLVSFGSGDLSLALCVNIVGEDDKCHSEAPGPGRCLPAPLGLYLLPALWNPAGFPNSRRVSTQLWVGLRGSGQQVWP